jgi:hypothetical protein
MNIIFAGQPLNLDRPSIFLAGQRRDRAKSPLGGRKRSTFSTISISPELFWSPSSSSFLPTSII